MKIVSILNLKGGVGKTITAVNMAAQLASVCQQRVILIDADPQANATRFFGGGTECGGLADFLDGQSDFYPNLLCVTQFERLSLLPCDSGLWAVDLDGLIGGPSDRIKRMVTLVDDITEDGETDIVLIDCPPGFTSTSVAALAASTDVLIPVKLDAWSLEGMAELAGQIESLRRINPEIRVDGCLITMWHNAEAIRLAEAQLRSGNVPVFSTVIRRSDKVDESTFLRLPLDDYSRWSSAARDYRAFVAEWMGKEGLTNGEEV
jgi:chromosome partitioning protein